MDSKSSHAKRTPLKPGKPRATARSFFILVIACSLVLSCSTQKEEAPATQMRLLEGYPPRIIDAINDLQNDLAPAAKQRAGMRFVISRSRTWDPRHTITVAFQAGTSALRHQISDAVGPWSRVAGVKFDFGTNSTGGDFREWTTTDTSYRADIRIAFERGGYWSVVGTDAIDPKIAKANTSSMNFEGFTEVLPQEWEATVLHEFGHALGFEHEHQSPVGPCQEDFRWDDDPGYLVTTDVYGQFVPDRQRRKPGIYRVLQGPPNKWSKGQVDFNLQKLAYSSDWIESPFDKSSIMKYYFEPWMFNGGENSACYSAQNLVLSALDQRAALQVYPRGPAGIRLAIDELLKANEELSKMTELPADLKSQYRTRAHSLKTSDK
jgi:hypothetical protein